MLIGTIGNAHTIPDNNNIQNVSHSTDAMFRSLDNKSYQMNGHWRISTRECLNNDEKENIHGNGAIRSHGIYRPIRLPQSCNTNFSDTISADQRLDNRRLGGTICLEYVIVLWLRAVVKSDWLEFRHVI